MRTLDAVTFDLWQTLIIDDRERGRARTQRRLDEAQIALSQEGLDYSIEHLREAYRGCFRACRAIHKDERDVSFDEQVRMFIDLVDDGLSSRLARETVERITHWYAEAFFDYPPRVDPAAREALEETARRGYRLGMISNTGMTPGTVFRRFLAQHDLLDFFDVLTFSDEALLCKPSPEMFHVTLEALGTSPERAVHLGDHIANDIAGGNRAGMWTALLGDADGQERIAEPHVQVSTLAEWPSALDAWLRAG